MARYRTSEEIYHYDRFKLLVLLLLLAALLALVLFGDQLGLPQDNVAGIPFGGDGGTAVVDGSDTVDESSGDGTLTGPAVPLLMAPQPGSEISSGETMFSGTAEPQTTVRVLANGQPVGETSVDANGNWSMPVNLPAGTYDITLETVDSNGVVIGTGGPYALSIAGQSVPTLDTPGEIGDDGMLTLTGSGQPGTQVQIVIDGQPVGTATVGPDGRWAMDIAAPEGESSIQLQTLDPSGAVIAESQPITIAEPGTETGTDTEAGTGTETDAGTGTETDAGTGTEGGTDQVPPAINIPGEETTIDPITGEFTLTGTAAPGATVEILVNGQPAGQAQADEQGNWSLNVVLTSPDDQVQVRVLDAEGNVDQTTDPVDLGVAGASPGLNLPGLILHNEETGRPELAVPDGSYTWSGSGLPGSQVEVVIDGQSMGTTTVDEQGQWSMTIDLPPGQHALQLNTLDADGNVIASTGTVPFGVVEAAQPTVSEPAEGWVEGPNEISGTAEPGSQVVVTVNGTIATTETADAEGNWTATVNLLAGSSTVQARAIDDQGQTVFGSAPVAVDLGGDQEEAVAAGVTEIMEQTGQMTILAGLGKSVGWEGQFAADGPYTVFGPADAAFAVLPPGTVEGWENNPATLTHILQHFIARGSFTIEQAVQAGALATLAGDTLTIQSDGTTVTVDGAKVIAADVPAGSNLIQVLGSVVLPALPPGVRAPVIDESGVPTFTGPELTVVGLAQPGSTIVLTLNNQLYGSPARVEGNGFWLVTDIVTPGEYEIIAYMYDASGALMAISKPVLLIAP